MVRAKKLRRDEQSGLLLIDRPEDMPNFATDEEEVAFWDTHTFSERFWKKAKHLTPDDVIKERSRRPHSGWIEVAVAAIAVGLAYGVRRLVSTLRK